MKNKVSIIIPCKEIESMTQKCIQGCLKLDYSDFEIIVLPDYVDKKILKKFSDKKIKIIATGKVKPAFKRNFGMKKAKGEFFAFIDSDAYPGKNWLKNAINYLKDKQIGIVGGPNLTPPGGNFWEEISGYALSNFLVSGHAAIRYKIVKNKYVSELPSCNYIVKKDAASEYYPNFLTAEDTKFCFDARSKGYKILYAGDVRVNHHRRDTFKGHLKQMFIYGRDNIWLLKKEFSLSKLHFFITTIGLIGFFLGIALSIFYPLIKNIFLSILIFYLIILFFTSIHKNIKTTFIVFITSVATHFAHGWGSLYGLLKKQEVDEVVK